MSKKNKRMILVTILVLVAIVVGVFIYQKSQEMTKEKMVDIIMNNLEREADDVIQYQEGDRIESIYLQGKKSGRFDRMYRLIYANGDRRFDLFDAYSSNLYHLKVTKEEIESKGLKEALLDAELTYDPIMQSK